MQIPRNEFIFKFQGTLLRVQKVIIRFWLESGSSSASRTHLTTFCRSFAHYACLRLCSAIFHFVQNNCHFCLLWLISANFAKKLIGKTWIWRQIMTSHTTLTKYKWHHMPLGEPPHDNFLRTPLLGHFANNYLRPWKMILQNKLAKEQLQQNPDQTVFCFSSAGQSSCNQNNGGCSHYCLDRGTGSVNCGCPCLMQLDASGFNCIPIKPCDVDLYVLIDASTAVDPNDCPFLSVSFFPKSWSLWLVSRNERVSLECFQLYWMFLTKDGKFYI